MKILPLSGALVALAGTLAAQPRSPNSLPPALPAAPSAARPDPSRVQPYRQSLRMVMVRGNHEQEIGSLDDAVVLADDNGKPAIIRIQSVNGPTGAMIDTAVADAGSLAPRWHSSWAENRILRLQFAPGRVTGTYKDAGEPPIDINQQVAENLFDANMLDVLICALPLVEGYQGRFTIYLYEVGGPTPVDVAVTGSESIDGTDTWITGVTISGHTARYYVGKTDHRVARIVSSPSPGVELRLVR